MRTIKTLTVAALLFLASTSLMGATFDVDPSHSSVGFKVKHLMISNVKGQFDTFNGSYVLEEGVLRSLKGEIDAKTVNTGVTKRDDHLRSADFFDVAKYPDITFVMTSFDGDKVTGDLSIHGITKSVTLDAEVSGIIKDPWGMRRSSISLEGKIDRKDFGLTWNKLLEAGGVTVGEEIKLSIELEGITQ